MSRRKFRLLTLSLVCTSLALRYLVLPNPLYGATHDDELIVRLGASILRGDWLGNYSDRGHMLLSKPAGYPLFLAWTHFLPWAPTMTVHLILLAGILLVARELRYMNMSRVFILLFIALSALHPQWFGAEMSRIYRDGLLAALTFLGLGLSLWLGRIIPTWIQKKLFRERVAVEVLIVSLLSGLTLSWSIATKPGWYPLAIVMFVLSTRRMICIRKVNWAIWLPRLAATAVVGVIGVTSIVGYVMLQNQRHYGISQLDSFSAGSFPDAINSWSSVKSDDSRKYILVDATQRKRVYAVSPTAKKMEPFLDVAPGVGWRSAACSSTLQICDESAAWFVWDLRDAMHSAGLDTSAKEFEASFAQISRDITTACRANTFQCSNSGIAPGVVSLGEMSKREIVDGYATAVTWLIFPSIGYTTRGGVAPDGSVTQDWDLVVRGLPDRTALNIYRPEVTAVGNTISLLQSLYAIIFPLLVLIALVNFVTSFFINSRIHGLQLISLISIFGIILFIGQLALLEASSGMYLTIGKGLYLLPAFSYLLLFTVIELSLVSTFFRGKLQDIPS